MIIKINKFNLKIRTLSGAHLGAPCAIPTGERTATFSVLGVSFPPYTCALPAWHRGSAAGNLEFLMVEL